MCCTPEFPPPAVRAKTSPPSADRTKQNYDIAVLNFPVFPGLFAHDFLISDHLADARWQRQPPPFPSLSPRDLSSSSSGLVIQQKKFCFICRMPRFRLFLFHFRQCRKRCSRMEARRLIVHDAAEFRTHQLAEYIIRRRKHLRPASEVLSRSILCWLSPSFAYV